MSAGPSPPNPTAPRKGSRPPGPTMLRRFSGPLLLGGLGLGVLYTYMVTRPPKTPGTPESNPLRTPGVRNIENAYSNGGATPTHTPAYGGSIQGSTGRRSDDAGLREGAGESTQFKRGLDTESVGEEQRPTQPTKVGEVWNKMKYGSGTAK